MIIHSTMYKAISKHNKYRMHPTAPREDQADNATDALASTLNLKEMGPPPPYHEIYVESFPHQQFPYVHNTTHYGACPTPAPPPYTSSPSHAQPTHKSVQKGVYIPQSGIMMPLNAAPLNFQPVEPSLRKKYAAYGCCAFFLVVIMIAAYLGKNSRKLHYHYRQNYDWNY